MRFEEDNSVRELLWTGGSDDAAADLVAEARLRPVRIPKNAFGPGVPCRDTLVLPHHRLLVSDWRAELCFSSPEVLAPAKALFATEMTARPVRYIHFLFARHELVTANGMPMESFHPGEMCKSALCPPAREAVFALFPRLRSSPTNWGPAARLSIPVRQAATLRATA